MNVSIFNKQLRILKSIKSPRDLKKFSVSELRRLAQEIRSLLVKTVAKSGGHLAPNLGVVELTIALHYVYNSPLDKLVWDVGHQAYTHKLLTGRFNRFKTMRQKGGISGYLKLTESEHDAFGAGHAGTAVSAALGMAEGRDLKKEKYDVVAIFGDGSLTNGLTYEGINNIGTRDSNITLVLNDNKWSISKNIGGIAKYLERLSAIHIEGEDHAELDQIFKALGFTYFGPIDGHNLNQLISVFELAKKTPGPKLVHVVTKKGAGYEYSEINPDKFHFTMPFILESGKIEKPSKKLTYSKAFGQALVKIADKDKKVLGITAAMPSGTALDQFAVKYPDRFFDVGIAESHGVTFAAGLALSGFKPVFAVYSSFLQRGYDEILHDVCLQNIPVIFCLDRAGIVGSDGPTHHGLFDLSYLRTIPNLAILAPKDENELGHILYSATKYNGPIAIRYPRGVCQGIKIDAEFKKLEIGKAEKISDGKDLAILAIGTMVYSAIEAVKELAKQGISVTLYNARSAKPLDQNMIKDVAKIGKVITIEENILDGGFGSAVLEEFEKNNFHNVITKRIGVEGFVGQGEVAELKADCGLTSENIVSSSMKMIKEKKE